MGIDVDKIGNIFFITKGVIAFTTMVTDSGREKSG